MDTPSTEVWVEFEVVSAANLPKMDFGLGKIDPYVIIVDSEQNTHQTPIIKSNYNPVWNHKVRIGRDCEVLLRDPWYWGVGKKKKGKRKMKRGGSEDDVEDVVMGR